MTSLLRRPQDSLEKMLLGGIIVAQWLLVLILTHGWRQSHIELLPGAILGLSILWFRKGQTSGRVNLLALIFVFFFFGHLLEHKFGSDVIRLRLVFRLIYYVLIAFILWRNERGSDPASVALAVLLTASGLPFSWTFHLAPNLLLFFPGLALWILLLKGNRIRLSPWIAGALIAFLVGMTLSFILAGQRFESALANTRWIVAIILFSVAVSGSYGQLRKAVLFPLLISLFYLSWGLTSNIVLEGVDSVWFNKRPFLAGMNTNDLAAGLLLYIPFLAGIYSKKKEYKFGKVVSIAGTAITAFFMLLCQSRIVTVSFLLFIGLFTFRKQLGLLWVAALRRRNMAIGGLILLLASGTVMGWGFLDWALKCNTFQARAVLWEASLHAIYDRPVWGYGGDSFAATAEHIQRPSGPNSPGFQVIEKHYEQNARLPSHNTALQSMQDFGVIVGAIPPVFGGIMFLVALAMILHPGGTTQRTSWRRALVPSTIIAFLFNGTFNYNLMIPHVLFLFALVSGMLMR
ncbi:MAG: hypothetical protein KDK37_08100, partial [Leptospiraceae bacterium]|nr:hypothetical protein [Leptospiraceae bacterium]